MATSYALSWHGLFSYKWNENGQAAFDVNLTWGKDMRIWICALPTNHCVQVHTKYKCRPRTSQVDLCQKIIRIEVLRKHLTVPIRRCYFLNKLIDIVSYRLWFLSDSKEKHPDFLYFLWVLTWCAEAASMCCQSAVQKLSSELKPRFGCMFFVFRFVLCQT